MRLRNLTVVAGLLLATTTPAWADNFLIHVHTGPNDPTEAALAFTVAAAAQKAGHTVTVFLAGDGASLITDAAIGSIDGKGTGKLKDAFDALIQGGVHFCFSRTQRQAAVSRDACLLRPLWCGVPIAVFGDPYAMRAGEA